MSLEPIAMGEIEPEATLEDCERVYGQIEQNANVGRGVVLRHIRDHRLYRDLFGTFEEYVEQRVGIVRQYAYRLIDLAGNGRFVRNVVEAAEEEREFRLGSGDIDLADLSTADLTTITADDMRAALSTVLGGLRLMS